MAVETTKNTIGVELTCPWIIPDSNPPQRCDATITVDLTLVTKEDAVEGDSKDRYVYTATVESQEVTCAKGHKSTVTGGLSVTVVPKYDVCTSVMKPPFII